MVWEFDRIPAPTLMKRASEILSFDNFVTGIGRRLFRNYDNSTQTICNIIAKLTPVFCRLVFKNLLIIT